VVVDDVLDDGQAQTGASRGPRPRRVDAVEALEDALLVLRRDAEALVRDGDIDEAPAAVAH
jgi:hypothetical protein